MWKASSDRETPRPSRSASSAAAGAFSRAALCDSLSWSARGGGKGDKDSHTRLRHQDEALEYADEDFADDVDTFMMKMIFDEGQDGEKSDLPAQVENEEAEARLESFLLSTLDQDVFE